MSVFLGLAAILTWTVSWWPVDPRRRVFLAVGDWVISAQADYLKLLIGACLPGVLAVVWALSEGRPQFHRLLSSLTNWEAPLRWYVAASGLPAGVLVASAFIVLLLFPVNPNHFSFKRFLNTFLTTLPFSPLWEELAWRAFALRKLETRYSQLLSATVLGGYWAIRHLPLWLMTLKVSRSNAAPVLFSACTSIVAWSVIWAYVYHRSSDSLPVVIVMHATYNATADQIETVIPHFRSQFVYVSAAFSVLLAVYFASLLRQRQNAAHPLEGAAGDGRGDRRTVSPSHSNR